MVTTKDIAKIAGVSASTVSAVLNGKSAEMRISSETSARVKEVALKIGYRPNRHAKSLRRGKSCNIGILLPAPRENCYANFIGEFEHTLSATEYSAIYGFWDSTETAKKAVLNVLSQQVDGLISVEPGLLPENIRIPVVSLFAESTRFDSVELDTADAFRQAVSYLKSLGHERIARVDCLPKNRKRAAMFHHILESESLSSDYLTDILPNTRLLQIESNIHRIVDWYCSHTAPPTAFVMSNDATAIALIGAFARRGINVPHDVSVIGMDNIRMATWISPALTTFDFTASGGVPSTALRCLFERLRAPGEEKVSLVVRAAMLVRESTWSAPGNKNTHKHKK